MAHPFKPMTEEEIAKFLAEARNAIVSINRADAAPLISPVWYIYEEECLYFSVTNDSAKHRYLQRDPRVAVCIDGGHPDERAVTIYGTAEMLEDEGDWPDAILWRCGCRYKDKEQHELLREYLESIKSETVLIGVNCESGTLIGRDYNQ